MFKSYKLNKYKDLMIGIAYDYGKPKDGSVIIRFYIVLMENDRYKFICLDKEKGHTAEAIMLFIKEYKASPINEYVESNVCKNRKVKKLVKD